MITMLVGLEVVDDTEYQRYRDAMTPMLHAAGGSFPYDFTVAQTLQSRAEHPINRVFLIAFPDRGTRDRFFADPAYLAVRREHFDRGVKGRTTIAEVET